ncbi:MAG: hypothetical protein RLZZ436_308, partial [Planctomycetota bacterium]
APWCPTLPTPERAGGSPRLRFGTLVPTPCQPLSGGAEAPGCDSGTLVPTAARRVSSHMTGRPEAPGCDSAPWCAPLPAASAARCQGSLPAGCRPAAHAGGRPLALTFSASPQKAGKACGRCQSAGAALVRVVRIRRCTDRRSGPAVADTGRFRTGQPIGGIAAELLLRARAHTPRPGLRLVAVSPSPQHL